MEKIISLNLDERIQAALSLGFGKNPIADKIMEFISYLSLTEIDKTGDKEGLVKAISYLRAEYAGYVHPSNVNVYSKIIALCDGHGYCWETNDNLTELCQVGIKNLEKILKNLKRYGLLVARNVARLPHDQKTRGKIRLLFCRHDVFMKQNADNAFVSWSKIQLDPNVFVPKRERTAPEPEHAINESIWLRTLDFPGGGRIKTNESCYLFRKQESFTPAHVYRRVSPKYLTDTSERWTCCGRSDKPKPSNRWTEILNDIKEAIEEYQTQK